MTAHSRIGGSWSTIEQIHARVGGTWKSIDTGYTKIAGTWQQFWSAAAPAVPVFVGATGATYPLAAGPRTVGFASSAVTGVEAGDLMLVMLSDDYTVPDWVQSGWTQVFYRSGFDGTSTVAFWYKYATSSDTTFSLSKSGTENSSLALNLVIFRNVEYDSYENTTINTDVAPSIDVSEAGSIVVVSAFGQDEPPGATLLPPSGYTLAVSAILDNAAAMATGYKLSVPSGTETPGSFSGLSLGNYLDVISVVLTPTPEPVTVQYLVIAGGGGGASGPNNIRGAGGAGAGGYRSSVTGESSGGGASAESALSLSPSISYTVTIGAGGAGGITTNGNDGSDSVFSSVTSIGGGGTTRQTDGRDGGSGGGASANGTGDRTGGLGEANQGFGGGDTFTLVPGGGAGGGGASAAGQNQVSGDGASGGGGLSSSITGSAVTRAAGGDGGSGVLGGIDGGDGTGNTGNGGGGGSGNNSIVGDFGDGGNGGSGVVIIKYPDTYTISVGAGLTSSTSSSGGYTVTQFTAGSDTVVFGDGTPISYTYIGHYENTDNTTTYTFNGINTGGTGMLVMSFAGEGSGVSPTVNSVSVSGQSAIKAAGNNETQGAQEIWYLELTNPAVTTVNVTVSTAQEGVRAALGVWRVNNYFSTTPIFTGTQVTSGLTSTITTSTLPSDSVVIAGFTDRDGGRTFTWSGVVENYETNTSEINSSFTGASTQLLSSQAVTVSVTTSASSAGLVLAVVAWR